MYGFHAPETGLRGEERTKERRKERRNAELLASTYIEVSTRLSILRAPETQGGPWNQILAFCSPKWTCDGNNPIVAARFIVRLLSMTVKPKIGNFSLLSWRFNNHHDLGLHTKWTGPAGWASALLESQPPALSGFGHFTPSADWVLDMYLRTRRR